MSSSDEEPIDEEPTNEEPTDEEPTDEEPTDEESIDEEPTDEEPSDEDPTNEELNYFRTFRKAVIDGDEGRINYLIRREGILKKNFHAYESTFLNVVARRGTIETAKKICEIEPDVDFVGDYNKTPIFYAIEHSVEMVKFFIDNGADVNFETCQFETPLHYAIIQSADTVKILLENGANVDATDDHGVTLLHEALLCGTEETVRLILDKILPETKKYKKIEKTEELVTILFDNIEFLDIVEKDYPLLVFFAAKIGKDDIFELILDEIREYLEIKRYLRFSKPRNSDNGDLTRFSDEVNLRGYYNRTALHYAVREQLPEVVRYLLKAGADVNCKTKVNLTPLHYAASLQNEEICKILVDFGADVNSTSPGSTPLYQVCGNSSVSEYLEDKSGYYYEECKPRMLNEAFHPKIMKFLLENGANPDIPGENGRTPFIEACLYGRLEPLKVLSQFGADLQIRDERGNSALHYAAVGNSLETVNFLLEKGFDINIRNDADFTPILLIMQKYRTNLLEMIEYLVDRGADVNARDFYGMTPLHIACIFLKSIEYVECLLELGAKVKLKHKFDIPGNPDLSHFHRGQKTLIAFTALHENSLEDFIHCYFEPHIYSLAEVFEYFRKCKLEMEKLKTTKIVQGTSVSFYNFLTGGFYNTVQMVKNEEIKKVFRSREHFRKFTSYCWLLQKRFERVIALTEAVDKVTNFLTNCLSGLPMLIIRKVLNLLSSSDFRKLDTNLSAIKNLIEPEEDPDLTFNGTYLSKIVEIRETGVLVDLHELMPPVLLLNSQLDADVEEIQIGQNVEVTYQGRYPTTGEIRITGKVTES